VDGGTVTLSGRVDSPVERDLAVRLARDLSGVDRVEDRLEVGPSDEAEPEPNRLYRIVREADTCTRVKLLLLRREPVEGLLVDVSTAGDRVTLSGVVRSEAGRQLAERIALRSTGVAEVENRIDIEADDS
jgi:osmotically-inducible protein OsmY